MKKVLIGLLALTVVVAVVLYIARGSKGKLYGDAIPEALKPTSIAEILNNKEEYSTIDSVIEGKITSICPIGGWFYLQDPSGQILVNNHPTYIFIPPKAGVQTKVMGRLVVTPQGPQFVGTGVIVK